MEDLLETARLLRAAGYDGDLHLKVLPGAGRTDIQEAALLANRISINVGTTSESRLRALTGVKDYGQYIMKRLSWVAEAKPGHHTTRLVVGAAGETDAEILSCVADLYQTARPSRVYYSAFRAVQKTRFKDRSSTPAWRTNRWYQADGLLREYGFSRSDLQQAMGIDGSPADADPKETLAGGRAKIDPNTAAREELLRVPGAGPRTARRILQVRESRVILPSDVGTGKLIPLRAAPFLTIVTAARQAVLSAF